ncbi:hypothetical protein VTJ04DRAFT_718 [Mycothermus thermophilus]|uniref:uncharacterized protein n=1 Tax=Humicola insolens TaxID=85995 RepID=UPI003743E227
MSDLHTRSRQDKEGLPGWEVFLGLDLTVAVIVILIWAAQAWYFRFNYMLLVSGRWRETGSLRARGWVGLMSDMLGSGPCQRDGPGLEAALLCVSSMCGVG